MTQPSGSPLVLQRVPLGFQWATADPFLFCVHHLDLYPAGNAQFGPQGSLAGRSIGNDFEPRDGWRMYHGSTVPGFPEHLTAGSRPSRSRARATSTTATRWVRRPASAAAMCSG